MPFTGRLMSDGVLPSLYNSLLFPYPMAISSNQGSPGLFLNLTSTTGVSVCLRYHRESFALSSIKVTYRTLGCTVFAENFRGRISKFLYRYYQNFIEFLLKMFSDCFQIFLNILKNFFYNLVKYSKISSKSSKISLN